MNKTLSEILFWFLSALILITTMMYSGEFIRTKHFALTLILPLIVLIFAIVNRVTIIKWIEKNIIETLKLNKNNENND